MKVLIAVDMEGISGVVNWDQVTPSHPEYARFRRLMTAEVNAAIRGALSGGADEVVVSDGHGDSTNLLLEELDGRARLNCGKLPPFQMVAGVEQGVDAAMFVGYHARAGAPNAILGHTWSASRVANVRLNGNLIGEIGINAALCGHYGVPVVMVSGDQSACAEAVELLGPLEVAIVKQARGNMGAECLSPGVAQETIAAAAATALERFRAGRGPQPYSPQRPIHMAIDFLHLEMAARAAAIPGTRWDESRRVEFSADDMPTAFRIFWAAVTISRP